MTESADDHSEGARNGDSDRSSTWVDVQALRRRIETMSSGEQAGLRRDPSTSLAFYKLHARFFPEVSRPETMERYATVVRVVAMLVQLYDSRQSLGTALANAGLSELRLTRLLRAEGAKLVTQLISCARLLEAKGEGQNFYDLSKLALHDRRGVANAEHVRRRIAGDYFKAVTKKNRKD